MLAAGIASTAALALTSLVLYDHNEDRLLRLRARELNLVLASTLPATQTPLATAAELANATAGNPRKFRAFIADYAGPGKQFASASLWRVRAGRAAPVALAGAAPLLASQRGGASSFLGRAIRPGSLNLTKILGGPRHPALGFAFALPKRPELVVYAENPLPADRRSKIERNSAFSDLHYVLYLGRSTTASALLVTNVAHLPLRGREASEAVPFGAGRFTLLVGPTGALGGSFFADLPWLIALAGALISLAAALAAGRLSAGRRRAEQLARDLDVVAAENRDLYRAQRSISTTLQHALMPDELPQPDGLQVSALYVPATTDVDIGGDWYDIVEVDNARALLIIGDVSGHGLQAATAMALVRHAALAYAAVDPEPAVVLGKLARFVGRRGLAGNFATVLCALLDVEGHELNIASAGHLPPLLLGAGRAEFLDVVADAAIGVSKQSVARYRATVHSVPPKATLLAFTDGLVERRGEVIDVGLMRLKTLASASEVALDELVATLARDLTSTDHPDDTAIVGMRWRS